MRPSRNFLRGNARFSDCRAIDEKAAVEGRQYAGRSEILEAFPHGAEIAAVFSKLDASLDESGVRSGMPDLAETSVYNTSGVAKSDRDGAFSMRHPGET